MDQSWYDAPKARKPWLSPLKIAALAILLLLGLGIWFLVSVINGQARVTIDYGKKSHELVRERQGMPPDAPHNWDALLAITAKYDKAMAAVQACST
jgi:hypothetical protein